MENISNEESIAMKAYLVNSIYSWSNLLYSTIMCYKALFNKLVISNEYG
jgi:hypothetical protein